MGRLDRKVAIVTGSAGLIGGAAARLCRRRGAGRPGRSGGSRGDRGGAAPGRFGKPGRHRRDAPDDVERMVRTTVERHGGVDVLLLNAGVEGVVQPIPAYPLDAFDQVMAVNVRGVFLGLKYGMPWLRGAAGAWSSRPSDSRAPRLPGRGHVRHGRRPRHRPYARGGARGRTTRRPGEHGEPGTDRRADDPVARGGAIPRCRGRRGSSWPPRSRSATTASRTRWPADDAVPGERREPGTARVAVYSVDGGMSAV